LREGSAAKGEATIPDCIMMLHGAYRDFMPNIAISNALLIVPRRRGDKLHLELGDA
jgi:hypothetical protein